MFGKLFEIAPAPPDGWKAFVVACCGCLLQTVNFGINGSFGFFINAIHEDKGLGNPSLNQIAIVGSVSSGLGPILGIFSGIVVAKLGSRFTCLFASICLTLSMILPALLANSIVTLILTYCVFIAFGGFMAAAGATANSTWFVKRKALGMGINFSGGGWGSLTIPYLAGTLQSKYHWRTCFLILSALTAVSIICSFFMCMRPEQETQAEDEEVKEEEQKCIGRENEKEEEEKEVNEAQSRDLLVNTSGPERETVTNPLVTSAVRENGEQQVLTTSDVSEEDKPITDWRVARHERKFTPKELFYHIILTKDFIILFMLFALFLLGFFAMHYSAVPYVSSMGKAGTIYADAPLVTVDRAVTIYVLFGIMRIIGGPSLGYLASVHVGDKVVNCMSCAVYSILLLVWIACRELWHHIVMMGLMGVCAAGFFATYPSMVGHKFHGPNLPIVMGIQFASSAVGGFAGPPLATALAVMNNGDYTTSLIVLSMVIFFATLLVTFGIDCDKVPCVCGHKENNKEMEGQGHSIGNSEGSENVPISS